MYRVVFACAALCGGLAHADDAPPPADEALRAKGEALAKAGQFAEAIDAFKAADRAHPRTSHACLVALAYARLARWSQAELFLGICHARATAADPIPSWAPAQDDEVAQRIASAGYAEVTFAVEPTGATIAISSFAPDEAFAPRTIHLAPGHYVASARADGFDDARAPFDVVDGRAVRVPIEMHRPSPPAPLPVAPPPASRAPDRVPYLVGGAGVALVAAGLIIRFTWLDDAREQLQTAHDREDRATWEIWSPRFDHRQDAELVLYGLGATAIVTGVVLRLSHHEDAARVGFAPTRGGGMIGVAWSR